MADFRAMYFALFHAVEDVLNQMDTVPGDLIEKASIYQALCQAQQRCEDIYTEADI